MEKGLIFNIQKYSIHDGPGIRTTVFLKGCPLHCKWCANPESQDPRIQILHDESKCQHCLICQKTCPVQAIDYINGKIEINHDRCLHCLQCIQHCPHQSLSYEGEYKAIDDIVKTCYQDIDFYLESDGGVTISGGEGLSQPTFVKELVHQLKDKNISVAIETTGYIKKEIFQEIAPLFDLLLFDVKHYDRQKHYEGTGVYNDLIIQNLKWAYENHLNVLPRIPVIPRFNETLKDAQGLSTLLCDIGFKRIQLLPFHQFGENKYSLLHLKYLYHGVPALHQEDLIDYQNIFIEKGLDCFF